MYVFLIIPEMWRQLVKYKEAFCLGLNRNKDPFTNRRHESGIINKVYRGQFFFESKSIFINSHIFSTHLSGIDLIFLSSYTFFNAFKFSLFGYRPSDRNTVFMSSGSTMWTIVRPNKDTLKIGPNSSNICWCILWHCRRPPFKMYRWIDPTTGIVLGPGISLKDRTSFPVVELLVACGTVDWCRLISWQMIGRDNRRGKTSFESDIVIDNLWVFFDLQIVYEQL